MAGLDSFAVLRCLDCERTAVLLDWRTSMSKSEGVLMRFDNKKPLFGYANDAVVMVCII